MRSKETAIGALGFVAALGLVIVTMWLVTPAELEAQACSYCGESSPNVFECGYPEGEPEERCQGGTGETCFDCDWFASVPSDLAPDGSLYRTGPASAEQVVLTGEQLSPGIFVLRSECSGAITNRLYTEGAAVRARQLSAVLVLD